MASGHMLADLVAIIGEVLVLYHVLDACVALDV